MGSEDATPPHTVVPPQLFQAPENLKHLRRVWRWAESHRSTRLPLRVLGLFGEDSELFVGKKEFKHKRAFSLTDMLGARG